VRVAPKPLPTKVGDIDIGVKWGYSCEQAPPGGDGYAFEAVVMTAEELLERYASGERDFSGVDLREARLSRADLSEINLSGADLIGANLTGANLTGARLMEAELLEARFDYVNLTGANLRNAKFFDLIHAGAGCIITDRTTMPDGRVVEEYVLL
jgi:hypothetical protein